MAENRIRHLPIVKLEKGVQRLVGVISMRDVFRMVMQRFEYDLSKVFAADKLEKTEQKSRERLVGIFTKDEQIKELLEKGSRFNSLLLMKGVPDHQNFDDLKSLMEQFDAVFIDLDDLTAVKVAKILARARKIKKNRCLFLSFNIPKMTEETNSALHTLAEHESVHLVPKPIAMGFLYEKFFKLIDGI